MAWLPRPANGTRGQPKAKKVKTNSRKIAGHASRPAEKPRGHRHGKFLRLWGGQDARLCNLLSFFLLSPLHYLFAFLFLAGSGSWRLFLLAATRTSCAGRAGTMRGPGESACGVNFTVRHDSNRSAFLLLGYQLCYSSRSHFIYPSLSLSLSWEQYPMA